MRALQRDRAQVSIRQNYALNRALLARQRAVYPEVCHDHRSNDPIDLRKYSDFDAFRRQGAKP